MAFLQDIGLKLILVAGLTAILIISVFAYFNIQSLDASLQAEVERHANQLSETVKYSTRHDMLMNQRDRIHQVINEVGRQSSISKVRVLNKTGEIIYSSVEEEIGTIGGQEGGELLRVPFRRPAAGTPADRGPYEGLPDASGFLPHARHHQSRSSTRKPAGRPTATSIRNSRPSSACWM